MSASVNATCFLLLATAPALTDATILDRRAPLGAAAKVLRGQTLKHNRFVSSRAALHWHSCARRPAAVPHLWCHHHTSIMKGSILAGVSSVKLEKRPCDVRQKGRSGGGNQERGRGFSREEAKHLNYNCAFADTTNNTFHLIQLLLPLTILVHRNLIEWLKHSLTWLLKQPPSQLANTATRFPQGKINLHAWTLPPFFFTTSHP